MFHFLSVLQVVIHIKNDTVIYILEDSFFLVVIQNLYQHLFCYGCASQEQRFLISEQHCMSPDFVYKQKTYFSEIDAFELAEEVVSESDLE